MATGFKWVRPPEYLAKEILAYEKKVLAAVHAVAAYVGQEMQNDARQNAPWEDRTGNARSGLFYAVDGFGLPPKIGRVSKGAGRSTGDAVIEESGGPNRLILVLSHTVYYGKFLEVSHGGKYAIVMSTIEGHLPQLEEMLRGVMGGGVGVRADSMASVI
jgi:hypothetical protein